MSKQREEIHRIVDNAINQIEVEIGEIKVIIFTWVFLTKKFCVHWLSAIETLLVG